MSEYWLDVVYVTNDIAFLVVNFADPMRSPIVADIEDSELKQLHEIEERYQSELEAFKQKIYRDLITQI